MQKVNPEPIKGAGQKLFGGITMVAFTQHDKTEPGEELEVAFAPRLNLAPSFPSISGDWRVFFLPFYLLKYSVAVQSVLCCVFIFQRTGTSCVRSTIEVLTV